MLIVGIDPHPGQHAVALVEKSGKLRELHVFPNTRQGQKAFLNWLKTHKVNALAVEGPTQPFFRSWAARLLELGYPLFPIPSQEVRLLRRVRARGKEDKTDAWLVARTYLNAPEAFPPLALPEWLLPLRELTRSHRALAEERKALRMRLKAARDPRVQAALTRVLASLEASLAELEAEIEARVKVLAPGLLSLTGVGPLLAAVLLAEVGPIERFASEAQFASYLGVAPLPWRSGAGGGERVNPFGNRRLNWAVHLIALNRLRWDPKSRAYWEKKRSEGKSKRSALRALKRQISRELYRALKAYFPPLAKAA